MDLILNIENGRFTFKALSKLRTKIRSMCHHEQLKIGFKCHNNSFQLPVKWEYPSDHMRPAGYQRLYCNSSNDRNYK